MPGHHHTHITAEPGNDSSGETRAACRARTRPSKYCRAGMTMVCAWTVPEVAHDGGLAHDLLDDVLDETTMSLKPSHIKPHRDNGIYTRVQVLGMGDTGRW